MHREYLLYTSAGDNTDFYDRWASEDRNYNIWCSYYGNEKSIPQNIKDNVDFYKRIKGPKWGCFHKLYHNRKEEINNYKAIILADDDIIITPKDIMTLYDTVMSNDLFMGLPSFNVEGYPPSKCDHGGLKTDPEYKLRYTSFLEMNFPCFRMDAL